MRALLAWIDTVRRRAVGMESWGPIAAGRIVRRLCEAGATRPETARPYRTATDYEDAVFMELLRRTVVREPTPGRYYVNQRAAAQSERTLFF